MPQRKNTESTEYISQFTLEKLFQEVEFDLRIKEFVVKTIDMSNYSMKLNVPYRSEY